MPARIIDLGPKSEVAIPSDVEAKANSTALAPAFSSSATYAEGQSCTYNGILYECVVAKTTASATTPDNDLYDSSHTSNHWIIKDLSTPDATFDVMTSGALRLVSKDGTTLWIEGYGLKTTSSNTPSDMANNKLEFAANATSEVSLVLPTIPTGMMGDFLISVTAAELDSTASSWPSAFSSASTYAVGDQVSYDSKIWRCTTAVSTAGAWTGSTNWEEAWPSLAISGLDNTLSVVVPKGEYLVDILSFEPGTMCLLMFTLTPFGVNGKPTWMVGRRDVENGGGAT